MVEELQDVLHEELVQDTDTCFVIDKFTREIKSSLSSGRTLIQFDHNSERFTFKLPRYIDNHDMSECNKVEVHYINVGIGGNNKHKDMCPVTDLHIDPEDQESVLCSWLVSQNATQFAGTLNFIIHYACVENDVTTYSWHTGIYKGVKIGEGINNIADVVELNADVIEQWRRDLASAGILSVEEIQKARDLAITDVNNTRIGAIEIFDRHVDEKVTAAGETVNQARDASLSSIKAAKEKAAAEIKAASSHIGENGTWVVAGNDTGVQARGPQGPQGKTGETGPQGESGVTAPVNGFFTLSVDPDGNLYAHTAKDGTEPALEYDEETGNLYFVTEEV
jgi:hypothetical protein